MADIDLTLADLEQAINYWRGLRPSTGEEQTLSPEVNRLARIYALMIYRHAQAVPLAELGESSRALIDAWRAARSVPPA